MPTIPVRGSSKASVVSAKPTSYVKFSDKLSASIDDIQKIIESHKQMIDSIQEIALELTSSIGTLHTLTVKYARTANQILDALLPIVKNLPLIPKNVTQMLVNLEAITQKIINNEAATSKTITDVRGGLQTGDVNKLKAHAGQLQNVTKTITSIIPKG
jgi:methyl-accepting chemotaxis protein